MAKRPVPRIKVERRQRRRTVHVRTYCRRKAESAYRKAERLRKSMPF